MKNNNPRLQQPTEHTLVGLSELQTVSHFKAPAAPVTPAYVPANHERVELLTDGKVDFEVGGRMATFSRGAMFWHRAQQPTVHLNHSDDPYQCLVLEFVVTGEEAPPPPRVCRWTEPDQALAFSNLMLETSQDPAFPRQLLAVQAYSRIVLEATRATRNDLLAEPWPPPLRKAVVYIEKSYLQNLSLAAVAEVAGVSIPYLHALFARHLTISPHRMVLNLRLKEARRYLVETTAKLREIAQQSGFSTPEYFCRMFTAEHGMSPMAYRRTYTRYWR